MPFETRKLAHSKNTSRKSGQAGFVQTQGLPITKILRHNRTPSKWKEKLQLLFFFDWHAFIRVF